MTRERGRELRRTKRTRRRNAAWIVLDGGVPIPCVLWDISGGGARITAARANSLPNVFGLFLTKDGKSRRFCRVMWRKDGQLGLRFIDESAADINLDPTPRRMRQKAVPDPPAARKVSQPVDVTMRQLMLPGCGPHVALDNERRPFAVSSFALGMLVLLATATALFAFASMQSDAPWALEVCDRAKNFCQHPEWTGAAGVVMTVVYLAVKGMER